MKKIFAEDSFKVFHKNNHPTAIEDGFVFTLVGNERLIVVDSSEDSVIYKFHSESMEFVFEVSSAFNWRNEDSFLVWMDKFVENVIDFDFLRCYCTLEDIRFAEL